MLYTVELATPVEPAAPPAHDPAPDHTCGYRIEAVGEGAARTAATQLLLAELSARGLRPAGPPGISLGPAA